MSRQDDLIKSNIANQDVAGATATIMRLRGAVQQSMTQSYFKFDSNDYKLTKKIYYSIESELVREQDEDDAKRYLSFLRQEEEVKVGERIEEVEESREVDNSKQIVESNPMDKGLEMKRNKEE